MRIALIGSPYVPIPPPKYGGTELVINYLIQGLKEAGHEPVLIGTGDSQVECELVPAIKKSIYFPKKKVDLVAHLKRRDRALRRFNEAVKGVVGSVDILHSHGFDLLPFQEYPNLTTIHNNINLSDFPYFLQRRKLHYVSVSHNQRRAFPRLRYVNTIYNGEDSSLFPVIDEPEDYVCFIGRFDEQKSPHLAIELALQAGIKIKLAGKLDYLGERYFKEKIKPYLKHELVEYLGELDAPAKTELVSKALCNLHPTSFREPFGLTVIEAAFCGTPTLAVARGAMPELILNGKTGALVEDFIEGFHQLEICFKLNRRYIASRARKRFDYKIMVDRYIRAYQKVIEKDQTTKKSVISLISKKRLIR